MAAIKYSLARWRSFFRKLIQKLEINAPWSHLEGFREIRPPIFGFELWKERQKM